MLKQKVRDVIDPGRNLGHVDKTYPVKETQKVGDGKDVDKAVAVTPAEGATMARREPCEDCEV